MAIKNIHRRFTQVGLGGTYPQKRNWKVSRKQESRERKRDKDN